MILNYNIPLTEYNKAKILMEANVLYNPINIIKQLQSEDCLLSDEIYDFEDPAFYEDYVMETMKKTAKKNFNLEYFYIMDFTDTTDRHGYIQTVFLKKLPTDCVERIGLGTSIDQIYIDEYNEGENNLIFEPIIQDDLSSNSIYSTAFKEKINKQYEEFLGK